MSPVKACTPSVIGGGYGARTELDLEAFNKTVDEYGYRARWHKAALCPNRDPKQQDHHRINCTFCDTTGFLYYDPIELYMLVTSFSTRQMYMPESRYEPGTAYFTPKSNYRISFWDKIELLEATARFSQVLPVKTSGLLYQLKYEAIDICRIVNSSNTEIASSTYDIDENGKLEFSVTPGGDFISVTYVYHPVYIVLDLIHHVRDSRITLNGADREAEFPRQVMARLDFLVRDEGRDE